MAEGQAAATKSGAPDPLIGRVIAGRFKVTSLIARGGMGKVYRAEQAPLGRLCAVKVLFPNYAGGADPEFHRRFFREASITSKITHPNCVTLFDYGKTDDDIYYMAMEYLEGQTLHLALRQGGVMHEVRAGKIATQICRALREAHKLGVIHRDLKPANIFLTRPNAIAPEASGSMPPVNEEDEDFVKVLDFGLVKHLSERPEEQLTQTGLFMGSPKYMAPEQIQGGQVDERTDIYSLGIIMYEMLAGKVPFERATSVNILMAHVGEPPPPMREVNPNLVCSPAFEEIVMRSIAKNPDERFSSMDELIVAIRRAHGGAMTGQLAAIPATSTSYPPPGSVPPSGSAPIPAAAAAPASFPPLGAAEPSNDVVPFAPAPRSKLWIALGVLLAAALGGGLGILAFEWTAPRPSGDPTLVGEGAASETSEDGEPAEPPEGELMSALPAEGEPADAPRSSEAALSRRRTIRVTTEPAGAQVRAGGAEVCAATPCDVVVEVDGSGAARELVVTRAGFHTETRSVGRGAERVHVSLTRLEGAPRATPKPKAPASKPEAASPAPKPAAAKPGPTSPAPKPEVTSPAPKPETTTPAGFKDVPY